MVWKLRSPHVASLALRSFWSSLERLTPNRFPGFTVGTLSLICLIFAMPVAVRNSAPIVMDAARCGHPVSGTDDCKFLQRLWTPLAY